MALTGWNRSLIAGVACTLTAGAWGCSSDEPSVADGPLPSGQSGGSAPWATGGAVGAGGNGGFDTEAPIVLEPVVGAGGGGTAGPQENDGGLVPLTPEQIEALTEGACASQSETVTALPPVLQFVVDISQSMEGVAPGNEPLTKWDITEEALIAALGSLPDEMPVGMLLYPTLDVSTRGGGNPGCVSNEGLVPIAPLGATPDGQTVDHRAGLVSAISATSLYLGTPTHDAYLFALDESLKLDTSGRRRFMLLITDGAPTQLLGCGPLINDDLMPDGPEATPIIEAIAQAHAEGVDTYIIGSPGSENGAPPMRPPGADMRPWLSEAAVAGGTALPGCTGTAGNYCHFDMTEAPDFGQALAEGLSSIAGEVQASCDFELPERKDVDVRATDVVIEWGDGTLQKANLDEMGDCTDGWRLTGATSMELCPATCEAFRADFSASVSVSFNCIPEVK